MQRYWLEAEKAKGICFQMQAYTFLKEAYKFILNAIAG